MNTLFSAVVIGAALWQPVTIAEIKKEVPEYIYLPGPLGSVEEGSKPRQEVIEGCPVLEEGKVVGFSFGCLGKK
jgi:hypothetical protein